MGVGSSGMVCVSQRGVARIGKTQCCVYQRVRIPYTNSIIKTAPQTSHMSLSVSTKMSPLFAYLPFPPLVCLEARGLRRDVLACHFTLKLEKCDLGGVWQVKSHVRRDD